MTPLSPRPPSAMPHTDYEPQPGSGPGVRARDTSNASHVVNRQHRECVESLMPRQPRLVLPGMAVHVIQRGNNRAPCFRTGNDYQLYLLHLRELSRKFGCAVHAYCLMSNHVHLLVTPPSAAACGALMRELGQRYVSYFNRRHERTGSLWEGRFRSCITDTAHYVLACYRYIELNPVRAGMVQHPQDYAWSSHGANADLRTDSLVSPHEEFLALGSDPRARARNYLGMFEQPLEPSLIGAIRKATNAGYPLWGQSPDSVPGP